MFGLTSLGLQMASLINKRSDQDMSNSENILKLFQIKVPLAIDEIKSVDYLMREGALIVTGHSEQVVLKSFSDQPAKHPIMQQISRENGLTCDVNFFHSEGDAEVRACGFENGAMALYICGDIYEAPQNAVKYFFPAESTRQSTTLIPYELQRND